ncbi:MAG: hypothetical protein KatS3mg028_1208 [Bacteroidia bacterium]|nr:MAG: hypothetical protein KatS3mg028_1208 [Bacteroidia bacterium]
MHGNTLVDYPAFEFGSWNLIRLQSKVIGVATHSFVSLRENLDSLILDAVDIKIKSISFGNKSIDNFRQKNNLLVIYLPKKLTKNEGASVTITYECVPKKGLYFIGWNDTLPYSQRQIWSQGQGIDNRHWIPMFDDMSDKITQDVIIRFNKHYQVISNGILVEKKDLKNNVSEWHYRMTKPHAPYLIMLAIGKYKTKSFVSKQWCENYGVLLSGQGILCRYYFSLFGTNDGFFGEGNRFKLSVGAVFGSACSGIHVWCDGKYDGYHFRRFFSGG